MEDRVDCAECGNRYDSGEHPFCPRCGSTRHDVVPQGQVAVRHDPRRRRVQIGGVVLLALGTLFTLNLLAALLIAPGGLAQGVAQVMADRPGGELIVEARSGSDVVVGATITVRSLSGVLIEEGHTNGNGTFTLSLDAHASVDVGGLGTNLTVFVPAGERLHATLVEGKPAEGVLLPGRLGTYLAVGQAFFLGLSLVLVAGGIQAIRLRTRRFVVAAASVGLGLGAILGIGFLSLTTLIPFALTLLAFVFILRGRDRFA